MAIVLWLDHACRHSVVLRRSVPSHHINIVMLPRSLISKRRHSFFATFMAHVAGSANPLAWSSMASREVFSVSSLTFFRILGTFASVRSACHLSSFLPVGLRVTTPEPLKRFSLSFILENFTRRTCALSVFS